MLRIDEIKRVLIEPFGNKREIRESDEKNSGMRDFSEKGASVR